MTESPVINCELASVKRTLPFQNHQNDHSDPCQAAMQGPFLDAVCRRSNQTRNPRPPAMIKKLTTPEQMGRFETLPCCCRTNQTQHYKRPRSHEKHCTKGLAPSKTGHECKSQQDDPTDLDQKAIRIRYHAKWISPDIRSRFNDSRKIIRVLRWTLFLAKM